MARAAVIVIRGRKRKPGNRHACGKLVQEKPIDPKVIALRMPHRRSVPAELAHDPLAETALGRYRLQRRITLAEWQAGDWYSGVVGRYRRDLESPNPNPPSISGAITGKSEEEPAPQGQPKVDMRTDQERARDNKETYNGAFEAMHEEGHHAQKWVARVVVYNEECPSEHFHQMRRGLLALAVHRRMCTSREALDIREQIMHKHFRNK